VKIGKTFSDWLRFNRGIQQGSGSRFSPYVFLTLISDLKTCVSGHNDTRFSDSNASKSDNSVMQNAANEICDWSHYHKININTKKTKEISVGSVSKDPPPLIPINNSSVKKVQSFKFLGVLLTSALS